MSSIFELLKGEVVEIVDFAVDHHKRTGNAPTLAVNAPSWCYANLSAKRVQEIRNRSGVDANPVESNILFYTLRILELGIRLHFVFDGPNRLHNGGKAHPGYDPPSQLLRDTLTQLAIPWHDAPGEAEAECAKMEMEGLADAVWSEDGDALAFGCQTLIRFYREIKLSTSNDQENKSHRYFRIYSLQKVATKHPGMTRAGFILNAVLKGGDSDSLGDLAPGDLLKAARDGLGRSLEVASKSEPDFRKWVDSELRSVLTDLGIDADVLQDFPSYSHVKDYTTPVVSTRETLLEFDQVEDTFDEYESFKFLAKNFHWNIKKWAKYIIPLRVVRSLLATRAGEESQHDHLKFKCDLKKTSKKVKAEFLVSAATSLDLPDEMEKTHQINTLTWLIRKARVNRLSTITSFYTTPQSGGASASGNQASRSDAFTATGNTASQSRATNGEGSFRIEPSRQRQITPPSPTPTPRVRNVALKMGASTSKNIRPVAIKEQDDTGSSKGKGKAVETPTAPKADSKRKRSAPKSKENKSKKARVEIDLTESSTESSNKDSDCALGTPQSPDEYGSAPATQELQKLLIPAAASKTVVIVDESDLDDEYGSVPSSPDLLALLDP